MNHTATFANFICRFGHEKFLLDYAEDIVIPAFTRDNFIRTVRKSNFHFYEVEPMVLNENESHPVLALCGRFIKETELTRHQIFDEKRGLVPDERSISSAPSVFFVLILNNHRLIYFPETPHAPSLENFKATAQNFLRKRHQEFIEEVYTKHEDSGDRITKKELYETHPKPDVEVVALTGADDISKFVQRYETLRQVRFKLIRPNPDIQGEDIFEEFRGFVDNLEGRNASLQASNPDGMNLDESTKAVQKATQSGNQQVYLYGFDGNGNKLTGNNENFQIKTPVENVPPTKLGVARRLYDSFRSLVENRSVSVPSESENVIKRIQYILMNL